MKQDWKTIDTDVLVIGGGVAGSMAASPALEAGLKVVICEKGKILDHCGSIGCGVDHYLTVMDSGPEWDMPEFLIKHVPELTDGIVDMAVASRVIHKMPRIFRKIESFGVDFKDPKLGTYYRLRSFGLPGTYHINFDGTDFKKHIGERVRKGKATVLMRTMVVQLLTEDNRAYGGLAFNFRTGEWYAIRAKAVVLAAGDVNRISRNASGLAFDSWHIPYNTGDAHAMGYRAGAALANMESVEATLSPKGFSCQGLNALVSLGAYFVNKSGERFMFKYDKKGENARRAVIADAAINEYLLGNGPIYLDCRHLPVEMLDHMEATLKVDRYTLPAYYEQKGIKFREELVEVSISELSIRRSGVYFRGSGLAVDTNGETSIEALFAAGDCATVRAARGRPCSDTSRAGASCSASNGLPDRSAGCRGARRIGGASDARQDRRKQFEHAADHRLLGGGALTGPGSRSICARWRKKEPLIRATICMAPARRRTSA